MMIFKTGIDCIKWTQLFQLYDKVGLVAGLAKSREYDKIKDSFVRSYKVVTAWDGDTLVGAGRLLSDGICYGMVFDLGVLPEYQRRGIGRGILDQLLQNNDHLRIHLTSTFGNEDFYRKNGFKQHKTAFAKYPFDSEYLRDWTSSGE